MKLNYRLLNSNILGAIISVTALIWLAQIYDIEDLTAPLRTANYWYLLIAIFIAISDFILRAIRWRILFVEHTPKKFSNVFRALMQGYLFNTLLPARAGELVKVFRLGKDEGLARVEILGTVVVERIGDMIALVLLMGAVFFLYPDFPHWLKFSGLVIMSITAIVTIILAVIHFHGHKLKPVFLLLINYVLPKRFLLRLEISGKIFIEGLAGLFKTKSIFFFFFFTAILWALEVLIAYYISGAFGLWIPLGNLLFLMLVITVGTIIPSSPGYIGVYELFGIAGLNLIGISGGESLSFIVMLHAIAILVPSIIGSLCLLKWPFKTNVFSSRGIRNE